MRRIHVVGSTGSGKTTLARTLATRLNIAHIELDALHWEPGWVEADMEVFRPRVAQALQGDAWVVDGNYNKVRDIIWSRADTVIWLDYPLPFILWRLFWRTLRRTLTQEELWNTNRESLRNAFFSRQSLFVWVFTSRRSLWERYSQPFPPEYAHLRKVHLRSPRETAAWLGRLPAPQCVNHPSGSR